jgi:hypothetical protein
MSQYLVDLELKSEERLSPFWTFLVSEMKTFEDEFAQRGIFKPPMAVILTEASCQWRKLSSEQKVQYQ